VKHLDKFSNSSCKDCQILYRALKQAEEAFAYTQEFCPKVTELAIEKIEEILSGIERK